jgi:hypothetical protein
MVNWFDWIHCVYHNKAYPFVYKKVGLDSLQVGSQINPTEFANKSRKKLGTLANFVSTWIVRLPFLVLNKL